MKKTLLAFLLIFTLLFGMVAFVGCDEPQNTESEENEEDKVEVKSVSLDKEKLTLKIGEKKKLKVIFYLQ